MLLHLNSSESWNDPTSQFPRVQQVVALGRFRRDLETPDWSKTAWVWAVVLPFPARTSRKLAHVSWP